MRGFAASSVSHQHGKGTKCLLFQGIFLGKGLWGKVGHRHVVGVWQGFLPGTAIWTAKGSNTRKNRQYTTTLSRKASSDVLFSSFFAFAWLVFALRWQPS